MSRRPLPSIVVLVVLGAGLLAGCTVESAATADPPAVSSAAAPTSGADTPTAVEAGAAFLAAQVQPDGRVVRTDQGGDTVSEGQAYAMLVAVGTGDARTFASVWRWTEVNLQRPDLLLSWRWADGAVADPSSASDADLDAARALVLAGTAFGDAGYTADGIALGTAVLDLETVQTGAGRVLTAGQWATTEPYAYNPSYASPVAVQVLGRASGDPRWAELAAGDRAVTTALLDRSPLPPDWAQVHADGRVEPMPGVQGRGQSVRYGYDAARTAIRFAESCDPADRALAARMAAPLDRGGDAAELDLGGTPMTDIRSVVAITAHAAAVAAAGDPGRGAAELADADQLQVQDPTYYGGAWAALGRLVLTEDALGGCPSIEASS